MTGSARPLARYGGAVAIAAVATLARMALDPIFGDGLPYPTYYLAVAVAAWSGGAGPALLTLGLGGAAASYFFIPPRQSLLIRGPSHLLGLGLYLGGGGVIALLCESLRVARRRAEENARIASDQRKW